MATLLEDSISDKTMANQFSEVEALSTNLNVVEAEETNYQKDSTLYVEQVDILYWENFIYSSHISRLLEEKNGL